MSEQQTAKPESKPKKTTLEIATEKARKVDPKLSGNDLQIVARWIAKGIDARRIDGEQKRKERKLAQIQKQRQKLAEEEAKLKSGQD